MERVIADTGFVVALINRLDQKHVEVRPVYFQHSKILLPRLALVEIAYLIGRDMSISVVVNFLKGLPDSRFEIVDVVDEDIKRAADIMSRYADSKVDFVDAVIMAVAERLNVKTVLTIDQRDFRLFRPLHCESFSLLP